MLLFGVAPAGSGAASGLLQTTPWPGGTMGLAIFVTVLASVSDHAAGGAELADGIASAFLAAAIAAGLAVLATAGTFPRTKPRRRELTCPPGR
ncbi:hypothetical protein [Actinocorallia aurantiaca]|uniref:Uncharacterized protein n=1 Tax=Actinocorallia aurantiaca TaxID=46204 RepID=A0ABP6H676_9ACTN